MITTMQLIEKYGEKTAVKRKGIITKIGDIEQYIYYIHKGLVRMYVYNDLGDECTFDFVPEGDYVNAFESYKFGKPSAIAIQALTDCILYRFSRETVSKAMQNSEIEITQYINVIENTFLRKLNREISLIRDSKMVQYKNLVNSRPDLFQTVPLKYIASYLGISDQTVSRFRKKIFS